jgi:hypothetical protein
MSTETPFHLSGAAAHVPARDHVPACDHVPARPHDHDGEHGRSRTPPTHAELLDADPGDLVAAAGAVRDRAHGARVTYSPKVFIPLTMLCRDRCGYCTFAKAPARVASPYLSIEEVVEIARRGRDAGCKEALFTLGEAPRTATRWRPAGLPTTATAPRSSTSWRAAVRWSRRPDSSPTPTQALSRQMTSRPCAR